MISILKILDYGNLHCTIKIGNTNKKEKVTISKKNENITDRIPFSNCSNHWPVDSEKY